MATKSPSDDEHQPPYGLPSSLLAIEGKTFAAIAMLQRHAGLNRERRRNLFSGGAPIRRTPSGDGVNLPKSERQLLTYLLDPKKRCRRFWEVFTRMSEGRPVEGTVAYALALELQLLRAYAPDWDSLPWDEAQLDGCSPWPSIRKHLDENIGGPAKQPSLCLFMLWPRIVTDIERWSELEDEHRIALGRAVFALSTVAATDWFIKDALRRCSALESEFKSLVTSYEDEGRPLEGTKVESDDERDASSSDGSQWRDQWLDLLQKLDGVRQRLEDAPGKEAAGQLVALSNEFEALAERMPDALLGLSKKYLQFVEELMLDLRLLGADEDFAWLDGALLAQIESRWSTAQLRAADENPLRALLDDASAAKGRCAEVAERYRQAAAEFSSLKSKVEDAVAGLAAARSMVERRAAERRKTDSQHAMINAEAALPTVQDQLLAAASPYEAPFDHQVDYRCEALQDATAEGEVGHGQAFDQAQRQGATLLSEKDEQSVPTEQFEPPTLSDSATDEPETDAATAGVEQHEPIDVELKEEPKRPDEQPVSTLSTTAHFPQGQEEPYSTTAGEACRPIWSLLRGGYLSLAYQFSNILREEDAHLKVPPPPLLACVALSNQLSLPDGAVKDVLADNFAKLSAEEFGQDSPRAWQTALNLLLAASTLKPMIIVPDVGASSIAGYLHLDARYKALYELVQQLRHFSERLQGFRIQPAILKMAGSEAGTLSELHALEQEARDWLTVQAPAITIKFSAATNVWRQWLKPEGIVSQLVAPVISNRSDSLKHVKELIETFADPMQVQRHVRKTDRKDVGRTRGEDIHAGALDHLTRCLDEALSLARRWVTLVEATGNTADRLRALLKGVREVIVAHRPRVEVELCATDDGDTWGLIGSAQRVVLEEIRSIGRLFDPASKQRLSEPFAAEALAQDVLLVPSLRLNDDWTIRAERAKTLVDVSGWVQAPCSWQAAFEARLHDGDLHGAELIAQKRDGADLSGEPQVELRRQRDSWRAALKRVIEEARREVEVGSAYGYLADSSRGLLESQLARIEANFDQMRRFDEAMDIVASVRQTVFRERDERTSAVKRSLSQLSALPEHHDGVGEIEKALAFGDIATANELLQRVVAGRPAWPEDDALVDRFGEFFPTGMQALDTWLDHQRRDAVEGAIKNGQSIPSLEMGRVAGAQRDQALKMFSAWSDLKAKKQGELGRLQLVLSGLGFAVQRIAADERHSGREVWNVEAGRLEDRAVCAIPHFGSSAKGRYRLVCLWERPAEDEIMQLVGESALQRATIVFYFGRMTERKWRETSRLAKANRKALLLVDEVLLVTLCGESGSRLPALFDLALPFSYSAPYDATAGLVPPEMFYGRNAELDAVRGLNGRCFIYGGRQLGKTALLRRAEQSFHAPSEGRYSRWIDLRAEGIGVSRGAGDVWTCLTEQLRAMQVFDADIPVPTASKRGSVDQIIARLREFLSSDADRRILLLLDEADRFFEQDGRNDFAETRRLKQLMHDTERRFKVVFAGLHNVLRMTERANHPLAHFGEPIKIGPLVDEHEVREAEDLIRRPMAAAGFDFESRALVIRILAQTNYYPSLIQLYCSHLLRHMLGRLGGTQRLQGPRYRITDRDIETVYSSGALRDEIRSKFRLTLQLDARYEVVAYALAHDALQGRFSHNEGMDWQSIRQTGAMVWWPQGFQDTSELDFRVLLDEMVELGVLSRVGEGRYTLRNPNVLLLLGSQEEIEAVLVKDREPTVEFESSAFRPPLRSAPDSPERNALTYQQLSELVRPVNAVAAVAGCSAGGIADVVRGLQDYLAHGARFELLDHCLDRNKFLAAIDRALKIKGGDGVTVMVVPPSIPWSLGWVKDAKARLDGSPGVNSAPRSISAARYRPMPTVIVSPLTSDAPCVVSTRNLSFRLEKTVLTASRCFASPVTRP